VHFRKDPRRVGQGFDRGRPDAEVATPRGNALDGSAMANVAGLAVSTIQKISKAHGQAPHRWQRFKLSNDPAFAEKLPA
jgi:hypothetical protein